MTGINPRLLAIISAINEWCQNNDTEYDIVCDESNIQGIKLFQKNRGLINSLFEYITPFLEKQNVHCEHEKVRGGTIIIFSLEAIAENIIQRIIAKIGEELEPMSFKDRIADAMSKKPIPKIVQESPQKPKKQSKKSLEYQFLMSAFKIVENKTAKPVQKPSKEKTGKQPTTVNKLFEDKISAIFGQSAKNTKIFKNQLNETLNGIATETGSQPADLFSRFAQALKVLGEQIKIGPIQNVLKQQGIDWKKSDDGQSIIMFIMNAQTKAPQPIARISSETLDNPSEFEEQLTNMLDFAKAEAPGTFKQRQEEMRNQEKAVREVAKSVSPEKTEIAQQMGTAQIANQNTAGVAAATTAATPKL